MHPDSHLPQTTGRSEGLAWASQTPRLPGVPLPRSCLGPTRPVVVGAARGWIAPGGRGGRRSETGRVQSVRSRPGAPWSSAVLGPAGSPEVAGPQAAPVSGVLPNLVPSASGSGSRRLGQISPEVRDHPSPRREDPQVSSTYRDGRLRASPARCGTHPRLPCATHAGPAPTRSRTSGGPRAEGPRNGKPLASVPCRGWREVFGPWDAGWRRPLEAGPRGRGWCGPRDGPRGSALTRKTLSRHEVHPLCRKRGTKPQGPEEHPRSLPF